ncbi:MAG: hypothetical protein JSR54_11275 [Proteobacteria bacterium]|nr:hypothetical protein [Pseudomonadota bacterium]
MRRLAVHHRVGDGLDAMDLLKSLVASRYRLRVEAPQSDQEQLRTLGALVRDRGARLPAV